MNDEHPHPEPDESRSSPAQPEDDIAALEREARARREGALLTMQEDEENDPVQPAIKKVKKAQARESHRVSGARRRCADWAGMGGQLGIPQSSLATG